MADPGPSTSTSSSRRRETSPAVTSSPGGSGGGSGPAPRWLTGLSESMASLKTWSACMALSDVAGDDDWRLLVADFSQSLKVFQARSLVADLALLEVPSAVAPFYMTDAQDRSHLRTPAVAVAAGPAVYIYRNLRPYYKYVVPGEAISAAEEAVWGDLRSGEISSLDAALQLERARDGDASVVLTSEAMEFVDSTVAERAAVATKLQKGQMGGDWPTQMQPVVVCMTVINRNLPTADDVGIIIIALESCKVIALAPESTGFRTLDETFLPSPPTHLAVMGQYNVNHRIAVACRDKNVYTMKKMEVQGNVVSMGVAAVGLEVVDLKSVVVATMDKRLRSFHVKGKQRWSHDMPCDIVATAVVRRDLENLTAVAVALEDGQIRFYKDKDHLSTLSVGGVVAGMVFGRYSRETDNLVVVLRSGDLLVKILPRTQRMDTLRGSKRSEVEEQGVALKLPQKTQVYVDQTEREREHATEMHRLFQRDLYHVRLETARAYVQTLDDGLVPTTSSAPVAGVSIKLNAKLIGLGPVFLITLSVENTGDDLVDSALLVADYNASLYDVELPFATFPLLVPGLVYNFSVHVTSIDAAGTAEDITLFVCRGSWANRASTTPLISARVKMPLSDNVPIE